MSVCHPLKSHQELLHGWDLGKPAPDGVLGMTASVCIIARPGNRETRAPMHSVSTRLS